eukprot:m.75750 g.75750  ORF g.75750 m.75750 type:complete len:107 (-) comp8494_c0_seq3:80-400(-)
MVSTTLVTVLFNPLPSSFFFHPPLPPRILQREDDGQVFHPFSNTSNLQPKKEPSIFMGSPYTGFGPGDEKMEYGRSTFREVDSCDEKAFSTTVKGTTYFGDHEEDV